MRDGRVGRIGVAEEKMNLESIFQEDSWIITHYYSYVE